MINARTYLGDLSAFVIPSQECNPFGMLELECQQQSHNFDAVVSPIDIVP